jgi:hypothetical protein
MCGSLDAESTLPVRSEYELEEMKNMRWELIGPSKSVFEKGGSLAVCIPNRIVTYLDLRPRDQLVFILDKKNRRLLAGKKDAMIVKVGKRKVAFYVPMTTRKLIEIANFTQPRRRKQSSRKDLR